VLLVKTKWTNFRYDTPVWLQRAAGRKGIYRVSTLITKKGITKDASFDAIALDLLRSPIHAKQFPQTVSYMNHRSQDFQSN
jgi:hypothetical protein